VPATLPSHQAAVLPLKVRFPRRFDGVALVIGSAAPDIGYVLAGIAQPPSHSWHSLLWFHLPVVLAATWLVRPAAPVVAAHLPASLRGYGVLGRVRHPLRVTAWSAVLGALSHQVWDAVTHPYMLFVGASAYLPALHATAVVGLPWWRVVHVVSEVVGVAVTIATLVHIGRQRLLVAWHGPTPDVPARPVVFWPVAVLTGVALGMASTVLPGNDIGIWVVGARWLSAGVLALLVAAMLMRARRHDPARRDRIIDAAIEVIAEHGAAATTHRMIATVADVPLGSLTYHFTSLEDLRTCAFTRHAERMSVIYAAHFDAVETYEQLVEAVTELIHGGAGADTHDWAVTYELYLAAVRDPVLRVVTERWMRTSRTVLERFVDPVTARGVDALIEGLVMHKTLSTSPLPRDQIRTIVRAVGETGEPRGDS
jgi:DNA-binding transcriptional regulator YbjK